MPEIMTLPEVAVFLRMSRAKVYALAQRGDLPVFYIGRSVRCRRSELIRWLDERTSK